MPDIAKLPDDFPATEHRAWDVYAIPFTESFETVCAELMMLGDRLLELLPDPTLGPDERLERLARVVPTSILAAAHHQTARTKLVRLRRRLDELVPDPAMTYRDKLEWLVQRVHELVPGDEPRLFKKLEALGDHRRSDMGR
jgi:hypothetical protein